MAALIKQLMSKMGLGDDAAIITKTTEILRLLELRSSNVPLQISEYGKIVLCADIASTVLGIPFDKEHALKISGLRKSQYSSSKRVFEKLLDCNKILGVNDICTQLNINEVSHKANEIFNIFKTVAANDNEGIDITHPQYAAMSVFCACKLTKKKVNKTKFMPFSNLRPTQWLILEQRWERMIAKYQKDIKLRDNDASKVSSHPEDKSSLDKNSVNKDERVQQGTAIEDYELWKERLLAIAGSKLKNGSELYKCKKIMGQLSLVKQ